MSSRVKLLFYIFPALWTLISGNTYIIHDHWEAEVTTCHDGEDNRTRTYEIKDPTITNLKYDFFNKKTVVIAGGEFLVKVTPPYAIEVTEIVLSEYHRYKNAKTYNGRFSIVGTDEIPQTAHIAITLRISKKGLFTIRNHVYVSSYGLTGLRPLAQSFIFTLKIAH